MTIKNEEEAAEHHLTEAEVEASTENMSILIPTLDFMAQVPPDLFPPLLPKDDNSELEFKSENEFETEEKYSDLYQKLMASTARSTALANRLAEMHQNRTSLEGDEVGNGNGEESDYDPRTEEDSIVANSPDIISEIASEVAEVDVEGKDSLLNHS